MQRKGEICARVWKMQQNGLAGQEEVFKTQS